MNWRANLRWASASDTGVGFERGLALVKICPYLRAQFDRCFY